MSNNVEDTNKKDYRSTLNITLNDKDPGAFPQRGSLPTKEPELQKRWEDNDIYGKSLAKPAPRVLDRQGAARHKDRFGVIQ